MTTVGSWEEETATHTMLDQVIHSERSIYILSLAVLKIKILSREEPRSFIIIIIITVSFTSDIYPDDVLSKGQWIGHLSKISK